MCTRKPVSLINLNFQKIVKSHNMAEKCQMIGCREISLKSFCSFHLKKPEVCDIQLTDSDFMSPVKFGSKLNETSKTSLNNSMAAARMMTNPIRIRKSRQIKKKLTKRLRKSITHNNKYLKVTVLKKKKSFVAPKMFVHSRELLKSEKACSAEDADSWCTSIDYQNCVQLENKHQIFIDQETKRLIFFVPRLVE